MDYNYFIKNPLKINLLNKNLEITKTYIILGNIDDTLYKNIIKHNEKPLKEFYGNTWADKLNIKLFDIKGFGQIEDTITEDTITEDIYSNIFNDDDVLDIDFDSVILNKDAITDSRDKKNININTDNDSIVYVKDISIFPFDTLYEIKKKIAFITNIQIYKQHFMTPITYDIIVSNEVYGHYYNFNNIIHGIPYDQNLYENKYNTTLKIYDNCKILNHTNEINIIPLDIFITDNNSILKLFKNEKEYADIIYYSFIFKYYPMINFEMFIQILNNNESEIDMYKPMKNIGYMIKTDEAIIKSFKDIDDNKKNIFIKNNYRTLIFSFNALIINNLSKINKTIDILDIFNDIEISKITNLECIYLHQINNMSTHNVIKINKNIIMNTQSINLINNIKNKSIEYTDNNYLLLSFNNYKIIIIENGNIDITVYHNEGQEYKNNTQLIDIIYEIINTNIKQINIGFNIIKQSIEIGIINYSIVQIKPINQYIFNMYKKALDYYYNNQILLNIEKSSPNNIAYAINKMVYMFPPMETYTFVDQLPITNINIKSYDIYIKNNIFSINFSNIYQNESIYALEIIYNILYLSKDKLLVSTDIRSTSTKLSHIDPVLFAYKGNDTYSRVCQKKYQPKAFNKQTYDKIENKNNIVQYPNITTGEQLYYKCPKEFPYMKFLKNYHPDGYCLPCCIKKDINTYSGYVDIHNTCIKTNLYPDEIKKNDINQHTKKYIINYSSNINNLVDINRIIELPTIFKTLNIYMDNEKYYIIKISSGQFAVANILANCLDIKFNDMINKIISNLKENDKLFNVLLTIDDIDYFNTNDDLIKYLNDILLSKINLSININWNNIFTKFAYIFNIQFIIIRDNDNILLETLNIIEGYSYIVIMINNNNYYPIWLFDNNTNIKQKIFTQNDNDYIIKYIQNIISIVTKKNNISTKLTYREIIDYAKHKNIKTTNFYNNIGLCYSIGINDNISCPIDEDISHKSFKRNIVPNSLPDYKDVIKFIQTYNDYIYNINKQYYESKDFNDYIREIKYNNRTKLNNIVDYDKYGKYIRIIKLIVNDKQISGMLINSGIIYIKPIEIIQFHTYTTNILNDNKKIMTRVWAVNDKQKYYGLRYSFQEINKNFIKQHNIYKYNEYIYASYHRYSYKMFISQIVNYYKLSGDKFTQSNLKYKEIEQNIIYKYNINDINKELLEPYITDIINNNNIETELNLFKLMNKNTIKETINTLCKQIFIYGTPKIDNMDFIDCYKKQYTYCRNKKMIMEKDTIIQYINLFAIDVQNPFKYDTINNLYTINKNNSYKTYTNEFIYII